jgi:hypothetical protein
MDWPIGRPRKYTIGREGNPYLTRWDLLGNRHTNWPHVYIHQFHRSDSDAALHSHPWLFFSAILKGGYYEATPTGTKWIKPWSILFRPLSWVHRIILKKGTAGKVWTLVVTGPKRQEWGFLCPKGWSHWTKVTARENAGLRGCE